MTSNQCQPVYHISSLSKGENEQLTRNTTPYCTVSPITTNFVRTQSKIDYAYWKTKSLIDGLIDLVIEKRDLVTAATQAVGETNRSILNELDIESKLGEPEEPSLFQHGAAHQPTASEANSSTKQLHKMMGNEKEKTQNLYRKYKQLYDQNQYLRRCELGNFQYEHSPEAYFASPQISNRKRQLFAELQNLKAENQMLRQQTLKILGGNNY